MITYSNESIFNSIATTIVNPVNCIGITRKDLALQFKHLYPENYKLYRQCCDAGELRIGTLHTTYEKGKRIVNLPTKIHWEGPSKLGYIIEGLSTLKQLVQRCGVKPIAVPALGCGLGGLDRVKVAKTITDTFKHLPDVQVTLYSPR